ncbi:MAG: hypothetical protein K2G46_03275 [Bacteroidales bacterium]|nr:hypothetical protein [Bacteroidales bacterium]
MIKTLRPDCENWISDFGELLRNERHMQVELADYLRKTEHYDKVYVEYAVPLAMLEKRGFEVSQKVKGKKNDWTKPVDFPWHNQMRIDIVVKKGEEFAAVELKYATTLIDKKLTAFEEALPKGVEIVKHQGAQDIVMYGYWKDVRRIEALTNFPKMVGGVALIVTNDSMYWNKPAKKPAYEPFSTHEGHTVGGKLVWTCATSNGCPSFKLDGAYYCHWKDTKIPFRARKDNAPFRYMLSLIPPKSIEQQIQESKEDK